MSHSALRRHACASGFGWLLVLAGGDALLLHRALGLGPVRFVVAAASAAAIVSAGGFVMRRLSSGRLVVWLRAGAIAGGGLLGALLYGGLVHGFSVEAAVACAGGLALVLVGERRPDAELPVPG